MLQYQRPQIGKGGVPMGFDDVRASGFDNQRWPHDRIARTQIIAVIDGGVVPAIAQIHRRRGLGDEGRLAWTRQDRFFRHVRLAHHFD